MINYANIAKAIALYEQMGFNYIEVPWRVSTDILSLTRPADSTKSDFILEGSNATRKGLIASGEQGFLYLMSKGMLPQGFYQTVTPCYRNDGHSETHLKQFMKLELIQVLPKNAPAHLVKASLNTMLEGAKIVFGSIGRVQVNTVNDLGDDPLAITPQTDLYINGVEVGSYGARSSWPGTWVYGTGLAEPRFSRAVNSTN